MKDHNIGENKKKRKIETVTTKISQLSSNYNPSQLLNNNKTDYDKLDKVPKSVRSTKIDSNSKSILKNESSFRTLTTANQTKYVIQEPLSSKQQSSNAQRNTRENEKILADINRHYENNDLGKPNKRWSDLPKPSPHFNLASNQTPVIALTGKKPKNKNIQVFEPESYQVIPEKSKVHTRTNSTSKIHIGSHENNSQLSVKEHSARNFTKIKQNNISIQDHNSQNNRYNLSNNDHNNESAHINIQKAHINLTKMTSNVIY